jgi:UMP-CMP kinase
MPRSKHILLAAAAAGATVAACLGIYHYIRSRKEKKTVVFVLGGPGSGKGTQCDLLAQKYCFEHISAGELLRTERRKNTETARLINSYISEGRLVPSEITTGLLAGAMEGSLCRKFLVDGFPRSNETYLVYHYALL